jgi:hypothetical protein
VRGITDISFPMFPVLFLCVVFPSPLSPSPPSLLSLSLSLSVSCVSSALLL